MGVNQHHAAYLGAIDPMLNRGNGREPGLKMSVEPDEQNEFRLV
jgi:hypothetical protein